MPKQPRNAWILKVIVLVSAVSLTMGCRLTPTPTLPPRPTATPGKFLFQIRIQDSETGDSVENAQVTIEVGDQAPVGANTDSEGYALFNIDQGRAGQLGKVLVKAQGYKDYNRHVNLIESNWPQVFKIERETEPTPAQMVLQHTPTPSHAPTPTATPMPPAPGETAMATATPAKSPTPSHIPTSQAEAIVLRNGTELRPGATTWWYPRQTLSKGTELELVGYDPSFPDWVLVRVAGTQTEGWTQTENLHINRELASLPRVTPRPTLTPTPSPNPTQPTGCGGGPLRFDFWGEPGSEQCVPGGRWSVNIHFMASGGDCVYTYWWEDQKVFGPTTVNDFIYTVTWGNAALTGTGMVESGGETIQHDLYVPKPPQCP